MLDTTVYIDTLEGTIPTAVEALLAHRPINHLSVILGELSHHFGRLDPNHPNTRAALPALASVIEEIPLHRVESASPGVVLEAGILAGLLIRLGGLPRGSESTALTDATLCLHALEKGAVVLTRNIRDFDLLDQIAPTGRVIFYRAE